MEADELIIGFRIHFRRRGRQDKIIEAPKWRYIYIYIYIYMWREASPVSSIVARTEECRADGKKGVEGGELLLAVKWAVLD